MSRQVRSTIIDQIGTELSAPVLAYVTGDRPGMQTQIGPDLLPLLPRHLEQLGRHERLALLLYTRGGDTNVPWTVISFLREHCDHLTVLVPFFAHSSGTLLSLGADEIVMTRFATLSPIDPTVANAFNPQDPANPAARVPIAVEDVLAFLDLAKENAKGADLARAFERLAEAVHPLALGNVKRSISQIRQLAKKLIALHPPARTAKELTALVNRLTTELYSHQHLISRDEALELGLPIVDGGDRVEGLLLEYYEALKADLELLEPFDPASLLRSVQPAAAPAAPAPPGGIPPAPVMPQVPSQLAPTNVRVGLERAYLETATTCDAYITRGEISQQLVPGNVQMTPGQPPVNVPMGAAIAFEIQSDRWEVVS